ncbi:MAG: tRNA uridine-5-carboxymethylaminomethyl(34) synthesis GTPase MnmE [Mycoplasmataceae bacterium]|nr:tRNA uridine-5-carboxymethylaminomethyl(34) synthesis GTPase MnmE [Mycoplasmataceae bacterium]
MKTIVALSTPPMNGAIHIIRMSGPKSFAIINRLTTQKIIKKGYIIQRSQLLDDKQVIDDVLINTFVAPKSFTGEDLVEINCHGGYYLANKIMQLLIKHGCTLALPGEFTQRAYLNNKLTIHEAESIHNLINATNEKAITLANMGLNPNTVKALKQLRENLFELIGQVEINIDYPEFDDVPYVTTKQFKSKLAKLIRVIKIIIQNSLKLMPIIEGINVAIVGKPNVGKSSLFNALLNQPRSIVSHIPGTTRDLIDARINLHGVTINLSDTAGIHQASNEIEKKGIAKAEEFLQQAALVLWVIDGSKPLTTADKRIQKLLVNKNHLIIINKSDIPNRAKINGIKISAKFNKIDNLINALVKKLQTNTPINTSNVILQSTHSIGYVQQALTELTEAKTLINIKQPLDLTMEHLHVALVNIDSILGYGKEYNFMNELFRKFCVGK